MKYFWKINIYEIQVILYWILGVLILHFGDWKWLGWVSIGYGWFTFVYTMTWAFFFKEEIKNEWVKEI